MFRYILFYIYMSNTQIKVCMHLFVYICTYTLHAQTLIHFMHILRYTFNNYACVHFLTCY